MDETPSSLQQRLKYIVERYQDWWVYGIFWQASKHNDNHLHLSFGDYFQGPKNFYQGVSGFDTRSELIIASAARSFALGEDIVGGTFAFGSSVWLAGDDMFRMNGGERGKEVYVHGIRTLVCVATYWGVVEFGSLDVLKEDWSLATLTKSLFSFESDLTITGNHLQIVQPLGQQDSLVLDHGSPSTLTGGNMPRSKGRKTKSSITDDINPKYKDMERERREKLNQLFYALRSVVPYVSKMDKASLLADAVTYIVELKSKIETLTKKSESVHLLVDDGAPMTQTLLSTNSMVHENEVQVKIVGSKVVIRVQSLAVNHPTARLMDAMKRLNIRVHHASMSNISDMMIQDVVAQIPEGFPNDERVLRASILDYL